MEKGDYHEMGLPMFWRILFLLWVPVQTPVLADDPSVIEELHICDGQYEDLICPFGEFLLIHSAHVGFTDSLNNTGVLDERQINCRPRDVPCEKEVTPSYDLFRATSYRAFYGVYLTESYVVCDGDLHYRANYFRVRYSCLTEFLANEVEACSMLPLTMVTMAQVTNQNWADGVDIAVDCECQFQPSNVGSVINLQLYVMYVDFPEQMACGEKLSFRGQGDSPLLEVCSPQWNVNSSSLAAEGTLFTLRFTKDFTNQYLYRKTKFWLIVTGDDYFNVTCGPYTELLRTEESNDLVYIYVMVPSGSGLMLLLVVFVVVYMLKGRHLHIEPPINNRRTSTSYHNRHFRYYRNTTFPEDIPSTTSEGQRQISVLDVTDVPHGGTVSSHGVEMCYQDTYSHPAQSAELDYKSGPDYVSVGEMPRPPMNKNFLHENASLHGNSSAR